MTKRYITLEAINIQVSLKEYVKGIRLAKQNPSQMFKHGLTTWWPVSGEEIMRQFRSGMHDRINQNIPYILRGGGEENA